MNNVIKKILIALCSILIAIVMIFLLLAVAFIYFDNYHPTKLEKSSSPTGEYTIAIYQIGSPFLFENHTIRAVLKKGYKTVEEKEFKLLTGGGSINGEDIAQVVWNSDSVEIHFSYETYWCSNPLVLELK